MDKNLETFLAVAKTGNLTEAAVTMNLTQPTLTKRLQQLEEIYDGALFERLPRGVKLTVVGEKLLQYAQRIHDEYLQSHEAVRSLQSSHFPVLRVGAGPLFQFRYLAPALAKLRQNFPKTQLTIEGGVNSDLLPRLRENRLDIVFGSFDETEVSNLVVFQDITRVQIGVLLRADDPLAHRTQVQAYEFANLSWVSYSKSPDYQNQVAGFFLRSGLKPPEFLVETTSYSLGMRMVSNGNYAMAIPIDLNTTIDRSLLTIIETTPPLAEFTTGVYTRQSSQNLPVITALVDAVLGKVGDGAVTKNPSE